MKNFSIAIVIALVLAATGYSLYPVFKALKTTNSEYLTPESSAEFPDGEYSQPEL